MLSDKLLHVPATLGHHCVIYFFGTYVMYHPIHTHTCALGTGFKLVFVKLMMFYYKTLLTPYVENKPQSARLTSGANMLDLRSEALA